MVVRLFKRSKRFRWLDLLGFDSDRIHQWQRLGLSSLLVLGIALATYLKDHSHFGHNQGPHRITEYSSAGSRHLLATNNDSDTSWEFHGPPWEDCSNFEMLYYPGAWVATHCICILILFIALAIICDDFFVPSLEAISEKLQLSEDVAGATFMAGGSSAPELFTSVVGVAAETDVGVGTIVGSAIFNLFIIIALTAALAGQVLFLDWRPLMRDAFFYAMSIGCFIGFAWDGWFTHYESVILLLLYSLYIILMVFNPKLMDWMATWKCCKPTVLPVDEESDGKLDSPDPETQESNVNSSKTDLKANNVSSAPPPQARKFSLGPGGHARRLSLISQRSNSDLNERHIFHHHQRGSIVGALSAHPHGHKKSLTPEDVIQEEKEEGENGKPEQEEEPEGEENLQLCPCLPCCPRVRTEPPDSEAARTEGGCMNWFKLIIRWILFIPAFPFVVLFSWTIPDCSKQHNKKWFMVSFIMSVLWIMVLSFSMVTFVGRMGCILQIDSFVMGLIIIAIGTSVPDALSSVLVARDGYGDMAVSNAIGSNVFDINLGLGLPFIIRICIDRGKPISLLDSKEWFSYTTGLMPIVPHAKFGFILLLLLTIALAIFAITKFRLTKIIGLSFVVIYLLFCTYAIIQEMYCLKTLNLYC